ncbi:Uncharacterized membrane protein [Malonomonas rubra DSM 5091]|uniref:Uncharacterized membrane protein n=2 Tax=Malonomonas rubra TaxID=57040 RepID=A0A1M6DQN0_MALRU|nr:Uncharacterized membrane protein [Malonomonas rubra DSM 5091]
MWVMQAASVLSTLLCSLVAGFLFSFAVVVMPGIKILDVRAFIRSFQVMDGVIQNNQLAFVLVWIGSIVFLPAAVLLGFWYLNGVGWSLLLIATLVYLLGVQLPTILINLPLNKQLQSQNVASLDEQSLKEVRDNFEQRWNLSNLFRTGVACLTSVLLMILLFIL